MGPVHNRQRGGVAVDLSFVFPLLPRRVYGVITCSCRPRIRAGAPPWFPVVAPPPAGIVPNFSENVVATAVATL